MAFNYLPEPSQRHFHYYDVTLLGVGTPAILDVAAGRYRIAPWCDDELVGIIPSSCFVAASEADRRGVDVSSGDYFGAYVEGRAPLVIDIDGQQPQLVFRGIATHRVSVTQIERER